MSLIALTLGLLAACDGGGSTFGPPDGDDTGRGGTPSLALWVWDTGIPGDAEATSDLLAFADAHGVTTLFMSCDPVGYGEPGAVERYTDLVEAAHAAGADVLGMSGYSWFTVPCDAGLQGQPTCWDEGWDLYEVCAASGVGFDGIMDDSEPASTPDGSWSTDFEQRAAWHLAYLEGIRERIGDLPLHHAIPAWYDERPALSLDGGATTDTFDAWIAGVVDVVGVMAYRDSAEAILPLVQTELARGPTWVGVETGPSEEGDQTTFADDGADALDAALAAMTAEIGGDPNLEGFMVHHYGSWRDLAP